MNLTETENFLTLSLTKLTELEDRQIEEGKFALPTDDARRALTGLTGTAFDLRQLQLKLESERKAIQAQLVSVENLVSHCSRQCVIASTLTTALMANTPPA